MIQHAPEMSIAKVRPLQPHKKHVSRGRAHHIVIPTMHIMSRRFPGKLLLQLVATASLSMVMEKHDAPAPVVLHTLLGGGVMLTGGHLNREEAWVPDPSSVQCIDGDMYLKLIRSSRQMQRMFGCPLSGNGFFDDLLDLRNRKCADVIATLSDRAEEHAPKSTIQGPSTVSFTAPAYHDCVPPDVLVLAFDANCKRPPCVKLTCEAMQYIIGAARSIRGSWRLFLKRRASGVPNFKNPETKWSTHRKSCKIIYRDAWNRLRSKHCKPRLDTPEEVELAEQTLHDFYVAEHHGDPIEEGHVGGDGQLGDDQVEEAALSDDEQL